MKPALLVIDVQKDFFDDPVSARSLDQAIEYINEAIELFRKQNLPVVCVQDIGESDHRVPGTEIFEVPDSLNILPGDQRIHKVYGNSFNKTELGSYLKQMGIDTLILTGYQAENCVLSTYRGAEDLDFTPILLRDALASSNPDNIQFVEKISEVITLGALEKLLGK